MKKIIIFFISILLAISLPIKIEAHSGGTDSSGCHVCRTNCAQYGLTTGQYHCHSSSRPSTNTNTNRPSSNTNTSSSSSNNSDSSSDNNSLSIWKIGFYGLGLYIFGKFTVNYIKKKYEINK